MNTRFRFIIIALAAIVLAYCVVSGYYYACVYILGLIGYMVWSQYREGTVFLATQAFHKQDYERTKKLLAEIKNPEFERLFVQWVRDAFQVKKKPEFLKNIILWAREIAGWNREKQKNFLNYASEIFRLALLQNYQSQDLVYKKINANGFNWEGFSKFISGANIVSILEEINTADLHLTRNGNPKIVWTDLGIKLSRYIHKT